jgi:hypothetical protein
MAAGLLLLAVPVVQAQQLFVPVSVAELCSMSDIIVDGTVTRVYMPRVSSVGKLETPVEIKITSTMKGPAGLKTVQLIEPGGKDPSGREEVYFGQIIPNAGERYILFLRRDSVGNYRAFGGLHSHYRIVNGRIVVHPAMPRILRTGFENAPVDKLLKEIRDELRTK